MTNVRGRIRAHELPGICQPMGMMSVVKIIIATQVKKQAVIVNQKRLKIRGTSSQNVDFSTSFVVAPQTLKTLIMSRAQRQNQKSHILYENTCARRAEDTLMLKPPKKKKLREL
jgi:hypothetical protein